MPAPMEVSLPQTVLQKLLDLLKLESFRPHQEIAIQSIIQDQKDAVICVPTSITTTNMKALRLLVYFTRPPRCWHLWRVTGIIRTDTERSTGVPLLSAAESNDYMESYKLIFSKCKPRLGLLLEPLARASFNWKQLLFK